MRRLDELYHEAKQLGLMIATPEGRPFNKAELMNQLALWHNRHTAKVDLLPQLPVMLARNVKDITAAQLEKMLESKNYVAEEKLDELRAKLHLGESFNRVDTRHRSDVTYEYNERTEQLPHLKNMQHNLAGTVLDGGLQSPVEHINFGKTKTDSWLTSTTAIVNSSPERAIEIQEAVGNCNYYAWDILFYCGTDVRKYLYKHRYKLLEEVYVQLPFIKLPIRCHSGHKAFYGSMVRGGGEGIMLKNLEMPYIDAGPGGCRRPKAMYKMKKHKEVDCFITGFVPGEGEFSGLVGSLLVSVNLHNQHGPLHKCQMLEIGAIQPGSLSFRQQITVAGSGELSPHMYGKVVSVTYLCKTKNNRMRHAALECFRDDKTIYECTSF